MGLANLVTPAKSGGVIILLGLKILALIGLAIVMVAPLAQSVLLSFMSTLPRDDMAVGTFTLLNYRNLFADPALIGSFQCRGVRSWVFQQLSSLLSSRYFSFT